MSKSACSMVLSIRGRHNANDALKDLVLFIGRLRVTTYLKLDACTQCSICLKFDQHQKKFTAHSAFTIFAALQGTYLHTGKHRECNLQDQSADIPRPSAPTSELLLKGAIPQNAPRILLSPLLQVPGNIEHQQLKPPTHPDGTDE